MTFCSVCVFILELTFGTLAAASIVTDHTASDLPKFQISGSPKQKAPCISPISTPPMAASSLPA